MISSIHREAIVETLLNSLEAEKYVRGPLLLNVIDELSADGFSPAAEFARRMFESYERGAVADHEFTDRVQELRRLVRLQSRASSRLASPNESIARAAARAPWNGDDARLLGVA